MPVEAKKMIAAALSGWEYRRMLDSAPLHPLDYFVSKRLRLRISAMTVLALGENQPTQQDILGMTHMWQFIRTADDAMDKRRNIDFPTTGELKSYVLNYEVYHGEGLRAGDILTRCLECYSPRQQERITTFLDGMWQLHLVQPGKGMPGQYSFEDALPYRDATNNPLADVIAELIGSTPTRMRSAAYVIQLIDDGSDWVEDMLEETFNFFVGMATNTGEVDYLKSLLPRWPGTNVPAQKTKINALFGTKNKHMRVTRSLYRQEILNQAPLIGGTSGKITQILARIVF